MAGSSDIMSSLVGKFRRALQRHGIVGLLKVATEHVTYFANSLRPSVRAEIQQRAQRCATFDKQFGVATSGCIHHTDLNVNNPNQLHAASYFGTDPKYFRDVIAALPIDYRRFVFIDFGSGKGRVILMATEFPFKRIIGVEFSDELHKIAQDNIRRFHSDIAKCNDVLSICMDAVEYPLPEDCLVCYFFNPFDATIMAQVVSNIKKSLLCYPREIFIVYANPVEGDLFDQADCFRRVGISGPVSIWGTTLVAQGNKE